MKTHMRESKIYAAVITITTQTKTTEVKQTLIEMEEEE
jgi:hypothetical protein